MVIDFEVVEVTVTFGGFGGSAERTITLETCEHSSEKAPFLKFQFDGGQMELVGQNVIFNLSGSHIIHISIE